MSGAPARIAIRVATVVSCACNRNAGGSRERVTSASAPLQQNAMQMAASSEARPQLVLNPTDDAEFRSLATALVESGASTPTELQDQLREQHPEAIVRPRELAGESALIWYVYRDGRWVPPGH
jgi:hypothetical protein